MTDVLQHHTPSEPKSFPMIPRHHRRFLALIVMAALECGGCGFKGAIYSSYQEGGLGVRTTAEGDAPIKVHFGYDRSVAAFVPRRGGKADAEEATALISKDQVGANLNPLRMGTDDVLTVDSAFITGTTAIVASAPKDSIVIVTAPPTAATNAGKPPGTGAETKPVKPSAAPEKAGGRERAVPGSLEFRTRGSAGERIGLALTQQPGRLSTCATSYLALQKKTGRGPEADKIYDKAAGKLPDDFKTLYQARRTKGQKPRVAFLTTKQDYLEGQPEDGARCKAINQALGEALEGK